MSTIPFDASAEVDRLKAQTKAIRKRNYARRKSRLDKYKGELLTLRRTGATYAELQRWLRDHRIKVALSTVSRYIQKNERPD